MNYDALDRDVRGYGRRMSCRAELRRAHRANATPRVAATQPARAQLAGVLRNLADHLDTGARGLA